MATKAFLRIDEVNEFCSKEFRAIRTSAGFDRNAANAWLVMLYCVAKDVKVTLENVSFAVSALRFSKDILVKHPVLDAMTDVFSLQFETSFIPVIERLAFESGNQFIKECYPLIVDKFFDFLSKEFGKSGMIEYMQPSQVTRIICRILKHYECKTIYNPFSGLNSYAVEMGSQRVKYALDSDDELIVTNKDLIAFLSQEINAATAAYAELRLDAHKLRNTEVLVEDSILNWRGNASFDAIVASPPFGLDLRKYEEGTKHLSTAEDFFIDKCTETPPSKVAICLVAPGFCTRNISCAIRKQIIDDGSLEMVIELPRGLFAGTGISASILVRSFNKKHNSVRFVDASSMVLLGAGKSKELDTRLVESAIFSRKESPSVKIISYDDIREQDYSLDSALYFESTQTYDGKRVVRVRDLVTLDRGTSPTDRHNYAFILSSEHFKSSFNDVLTPSNENKIAPPSSICKEHFGDAVITSYVNDKVCVYIHRGPNEFYTKPNQLTFKPLRGAVSLEYFALLLLQYPVFRQLFSRGASTITVEPSAILALKLPIDANQQVAVDSALALDRDKKKAQLRAEAERLGLSSDINDLVHMLGTSFTNQGEVFKYLSNPARKLSDDVALGIYALKEISDYMHRIITSFGQDLSTAQYSRVNVQPVAFMKQFMKSWQIVGRKEFSLQLLPFEDALRNVIISADEDKLKLLLETLLDNAYRHGFNKGDLQVPGGNLAAISLDLVRFSERVYLKIAVMNNGNPLAYGFTLRDFITKGRFSKESGNTGLGGNHVYNITKAHKGFLSLSSDKEWNYIVEILLPVENASIDTSFDISNYESDCL